MPPPKSKGRYRNCDPWVIAWLIKDALQCRGEEYLSYPHRALFDRMSTRTLLTYLPNVDTISQAITFYFTFTFSTPYEPFIPLQGANTSLFFPNGSRDQRNQALITLRNGIAAFIDDYQPRNPQRFQWPLNIET